MFKLSTLRNNLLLIIMLSVVILLISSTRVQAATLTVSAGTDTIAEDGVCHLSEAIANVNDQAQTHADCPAGNGNDTIVLPEGTITLSGDLPRITQDVTVRGQGMGKTTVDGASSYEVFGNASAAGNKLTVEDLKIVAFSTSAIAAIDTNLIVNNVEIDGLGVVGSDIFGTGSPEVHPIVSIASSISITTKVNNLYVHGVNVSGDYNAISAGFIVGGDVTIANSTFTGISHSGGQLSSGAGLTLIPAVDTNFAEMNIKLENITINNLSFETAQMVTSALNLGSTAGGPAVVTADVKNVTVVNNKLAIGMLGEAPGVSITAFASNQAETATITANFQNIIIANNTANDTKQSCTIKNLNDLAGGSGEVNLNITSNGGNLTDDTSCKDHLTHPTDKHNITNLKDSLGPLGSHGGEVPTIPLLPGNPAIDGGVCENAPSSDARGVARPQGAGCDAGAYEVEQASMAGSTGTSSPGTNKKIFLDPPVPGSVVTSAESLPATTAQNDTGYDYPLGLVSFTIEGVPSASTQTISLYFETDEKAEDFILRKFNPNTEQFSIIDSAQLINVTKNGTPAIKVTYPITDGGALDIDGQANGILVDPVGLARDNNGLLAETGIPIITVSFVGLLLIFGATYTYIDYRKHKKPLQEADPYLASKYTYWHHMKLVTLPLLKYRISISLEKKRSVPAGDVQA